MGAYVTINPTPSGDITGSGTPNYLAMFTSANVIGDSVIYQSGSKVYVSAANTFAVNTSTPSFSVGYDSQTITIAGVSYSAIESSYINAGTSVNNQAMAASATASVASVYLGARSRGTFASPTAVQSGDSIHSFYSVGHDGTDYAIATAVEHIVGGTVAANQVPGRIKFSTANSSGTLTEAMSIYSTQQVSIGNYASPTNQRLLTIGQDTAYMSFGSLVGATSQPAVYMNQATPSATNYSLTADSATTVVNGSTSLALKVAAVDRLLIRGVTSSGANPTFDFTNTANTNQTASTEAPYFKVTGATKTWAAGAITTQRWNYFTANTAAFASASTITNSYGLYVEAATAGTNATITNNYGIGTDGKIYAAGEINGNYFSIGGANALSLSSTSLQIGTSSFYTANRIMTNGITRLETLGLTTSGITSAFVFSPASCTTQNSGVEISGYLYNSYSRQWNTGAITTQREHYLKTVTYSFVGASTITNAYGLYVEAATAGTNATITNNWALGTNGGIFLNGTANTVLGSAALATTATSGFLHVPSCAGVPTGVPTLYTGMIPIVCDSTNNKMYIYSGGAWVALN